ncbi:MAG: hypothetical protein U0457_12870 [Candidatus Sericytochromatia bacterium]
MLTGKKNINIITAAIISAFSLASCGGNLPTSDFEASSPYYQPAVVQQVQNLTTTQNQNCCNCTCQNPSNSTATTDTSDVTKKKKKTKTKTTTPTTTTANNTPTTPAATATPAPAQDNTDKGRKALDKVLAYLSAPNAFEATVEKYEKALSGTKEQTQKLKVLGKKPGKVKFDILEHTNPNSVGAKLTYVRGSGKATVRPGGALKFITKELDMNDSNITSPNEYTPEQMDFFGLVDRLSNSAYKAELNGKTTIDGKELFLLKITSSNNSLDSKITYEIIGFDGSTFQPLLWEVYAGSDTPYVKMTIKSYSQMSDIPDSQFKV